MEMSTDALAVAREMAAADPRVDALLADPATAFEVRVLRAAQRVVATKGLGASMDDIASAAGVGRRSLFRHFENRDELVAQAVTLALDSYGRAVSRTVTGDDRPLEQWLEDVIASSHRAHLDGGVGLWQLAAADDGDLAPPLAAVNRRRRAARTAWTTSLADAMWRRAGRRGRAPTVLVDAVGLAMSSFATRSMIEDLGRDLRRTTRSTTSLLLALLDTATREAPRGRT